MVDIAVMQLSFWIGISIHPKLLINFNDINFYEINRFLLSKIMQFKILENNNYDDLNIFYFKFYVKLEKQLVNLICLKQKEVLKYRKLKR